MILALALIAFFSVVTVSLARFQDIAVLQPHRNQVTATTDSPIEGAAAYSLADASRGDWACVGTPVGRITMADAAGTSLQYSTNQCNPQRNGQTFSGFPCSLCALATGATGGISDNKEPITITGGGAVVSNSSLSVKSTTLTVTGGGNIWYETTVAPPLTNYSPAPQPLTALLPDPLAYLPNPLTYLTATTTPPLVRTNCSASSPSPCLASPGGSVYNPGVYQDLAVSGSGTTYLNPGVYVFTGLLSVTGGASLLVNCAPPGSPPSACLTTDARGVLLYFTCGTSASPQPCAANANGGGLSVAGGGGVTLQAASSGVFAHVMAFYDPNNLGNAGTPGFQITGNGNYTFYGATYARSALLTLRGNGNTVGFVGPIVVASMSLSGSGSSPTLTLQGLGAGSATCTVFDNELSVAGTIQGHDGVQAGPGCIGGSEIVGFNYAP